MMHRALNHNDIRKETTMNAQEHPTIQQLRNAYDAEMKNILTNKRNTTHHIAKGNGLQKRRL